ncbi:MAG: RNA-binding domain-containing protein [Candidatus Bathyarchaeia archaeon]
MDRVSIAAEAEVNPTEDPEKVKHAIQNIILNPTFEQISVESESLLVARVEGREGLTKLYNLLRQERILDAARRVMFRGVGDNRITFYLNKQVAYVGHISFCQPEAESPLGPIKIVITCDDPEALIEWLAPRTIRR